MSRFTYCLFDLDGTLSASAPGITRCVQYALHCLGIEEPDLKSLETFVGPPLGDEFKRRYGFDDRTCAIAIDRYRERYRKAGIFECELYPGIQEMLQAQYEAGQKLAVASSKPEAFVKQIMEHFQIAPYFSAICGAPMDEEKQGALANGVVPVGVTFGYGTREELEEAGCRLIAADSKALERILLS